MSQMSCSRVSLVCCKLAVLNQIAAVWEKSRPKQYFGLQFTPTVHSGGFLGKTGTISAQSCPITLKQLWKISTVLVFSECQFEHMLALKKKINFPFVILYSLT